MRKFLIVAALAVVACSQPQDRLLSGGKPVKDLKVIVNEQPAGDMLLRTVSFVNTGFDAVQVDAMETSWVSVKGGETWTFQPSSSSERLDWAFPVEDGFYQETSSESRKTMAEASLWSPSGPPRTTYPPASPSPS